MTSTIRTACERCGTCCRNGGPALHHRDRVLVESKVVPRDALVTIRQGELAQHPLAPHPEPVRQEFLKVKGRNARWSCCFFDEQADSCAIYLHRPFSCSILKCWSPQEAVALIGQDLLSRFDLIADSDPLLPLVRWQEQNCPCPDLAEIGREVRTPSQREATLQQLSGVVNKDLALRRLAIRDYNLSVDQELFYFGRPLFHLLAAVGVTGIETGAGMVLRCQG